MQVMKDILAHFFALQPRRPMCLMQLSKSTGLLREIMDMPVLKVSFLRETLVIYLNLEVIRKTTELSSYSFQC